MPQVASRDAVVQQPECVSEVEVKALVDEGQIDAALERCGLGADDAQRMFVTFYDTPALLFFDANIIGRTRRVIGGEHDSTIKFRPVVPARIESRWRDKKGFKLEADSAGGQPLIAASMTKKVEKGLIKKVHEGAAPVEALFTPDQEAFLFSLAGRSLDYARIVPFGPVSAWKWKKQQHAGLPWPITVELWRRDDGARLFEVSIRVPIEQARVAAAALQIFLDDLGARLQTDPQGKTRWVLEHHATLRSVPTLPERLEKDPACP